MSGTRAQGDRPGFDRKTFSFEERLKEIDRFFAGRSTVHQTMRRLVRRLERAAIDYAIYGGMAVNAYGHHQTTDDVDVLLTAEGLTEFRRKFADQYEVTQLRQGRRFLDRANGVAIDVVVTGHCLGVRKPGAVCYPDPARVSEILDSIRYVNLFWLIQLKLATGRYRDLGDVTALIHVHELDESFLEKLHPSVRQNFIACLEEKQREGEFEDQ